MRLLSLASIVAPSLLIGLVGCESTSEDVGSQEARATEDANTALARKAVNIIAGPSGRCVSCHTAGHDEIERWGVSMKKIEDECLAPSLAMSATQRVACLERDELSATKLGMYSAGAMHAQFETLYKEAFPADEWQDRFNTFKMSGQMPAGGRNAMTATEFATVKEWVLAGMPKLDEVLAEPGAFPCEPKSSPELRAHMDEMKASGWAARLSEASTPMANCGDAETAAGCLTEFGDITARWGYEGTDQVLREVKKLAFRTSYWTRTSPDGRFAAFGGSPSKILDLTQPNAEPIKAQAPYDPGFFPNNDGFSFAGTQAGGLRVCRTSVLLNAMASPSRTITFSEPGCSRIIDTVYQSVGAALDGSLYFMATGAHTNDAGGSSGPISASFGENAMTTLTPMFNDGTKYVPGTAVNVKIPHEGDQQMSPSNTLLITRFGQKDGYSGYRIRKVTPTFGSSSGAVSQVSVSTKEIGTVCLSGGKPQLSFDERFMVVHQYTDPAANPQGLPLQSSNIFLVDLRTGKQVQITKMGQNQRALFPHFRADGWIYFLVKDSNGGGQETLVGTDAAIRLAQGS